MELATACYTAIDYDARDSAAALQLKVIGVGAIFIAGALGVSLPFIGRGFRFLSTEGNIFFITRAFAAGVILATGFVHILPEGMEALRNPCLPELCLSFPLGGFVAMLSALTTLFVDNMCTEYYEDQHAHQKHAGQSEREPLISKSAASTDGRPDRQFLREKSLLRLGSHHAEVTVSIKKLISENSVGNVRHVQEIGDVGEHHLSEEEAAQIRNVVILQVLEVAVISHSFIIGVSLGISENPRLITPLLAALSFHQFFEGFALGGSICQVRVDFARGKITGCRLRSAERFSLSNHLFVVNAGAAFECTSSTVRAGLFAVTTPLGILVGIGVESSYQANTANAVILEGLFECASAGILIYMAGTLGMSSLAFWA